MSGSNDRSYSVKVFEPCRLVFGMTLKEFPQPLCASVFIIQVHLNVYIIDVKMLLHRQHLRPVTTLDVSMFRKLSLSLYSIPNSVCHTECLLLLLNVAGC